MLFPAKGDMNIWTIEKDMNLASDLMDTVDFSSLSIGSQTEKIYSVEGTKRLKRFFTIGYPLFNSGNQASIIMIL
jgi:hypothetical protein